MIENDRPSLIFLFIEDRIAETGVAPSYEEIMEHVGLKSKNSVRQYLEELETEGLIRRLPKRARAIEILIPTRDAKDDYREMQKLVAAMDIPPPRSLTGPLLVSQSLRERGAQTIVPSVAAEGQQ